MFIAISEGIRTSKIREEESITELCLTFVGGTGGAQVAAGTASHPPEAEDHQCTCGKLRGQAQLHPSQPTIRITHRPLDPL